jgi:hypothetical protein
MAELFAPIGGFSSRRNLGVLRRLHARGLPRALGKGLRNTDAGVVHECVERTEACYNGVDRLVGRGGNGRYRRVPLSPPVKSGRSHQLVGLTASPVESLI